MKLYNSRKVLDRMDFLQKVNDRIEENRAEMISSLSRLISIPSVATDAKGSCPFGEDVQKAYDMMLDLAQSEGFGTFDADGYGGHIDFAGSGSGIVGIIGHLDVVPEGEGWDFDPYGGEVISGMVCGRGAVDDKGPVVASFYAMKALKDCGYEPQRTIRLILGLDEETNWHGMEHYLLMVDERPDFGFTPDGDFPAIHGEMGIMIFDIAGKFSHGSVKGLQLRSIKGGTAANAVAGSARAVLYNSAGGGYDGVREALDKFRESRGFSIRCKGVGRSLEITADGVPAHGAKPEKGLNAISVLMAFLGGLNFASESTNDFIAFYNSHIGFDLHGENIGCDFADEVSGRLVFNVGMISLDRDSVRLTVNIRYPVTMNAEMVYDGIMGVIGEYDLGIVKGHHQEPIYIPADDPLIVTLMDVYRKHTGDMTGEAEVIGGGTYARAMDGIVAFGARFPEDPELEHQRNECISVENMVRLAKIYAEAAVRLSEL